MYATKIRSLKAVATTRRAAQGIPILHSNLIEGCPQHRIVIVSLQDIIEVVKELGLSENADGS